MFSEGDSPFEYLSILSGAGHNNIEAMLRTTGLFVSKLVEFLDLHIPARRGIVSRPTEVPECVPSALRELESARVR
jgi:hypothetical protein